MYTTLITSTELANHFTDPDWVICDCRYDLSNPTQGHSDYLKGHIPHALYVDLERDLSAFPSGVDGRHPLPSINKLTALIESLGIENQSQVIVYDDAGGGYAARLWWILRYLGHEAAAVLDGGIRAWVEAGYELSSGVEHREPSTFHADAQPDRLITVDQLTETPPGREILLLDARAPERYRGEEEPLDPVAGHIPGAENRYWRDNLDSQEYFKSPYELREDLEYFLQDRLAEDAIMYCGSGVTACHNILAFMIAGYKMPRLYAGAWSEWCSDSSRSIAIGDSDVSH